MATMVQAQVLYDSLLHRYSSSLTYSGATVAGFEPMNAVDWRDFSLFRAATGTTYLKAQATANATIDTVVAWLATPITGNIVLTVETSPDNVAWTARGTVTLTPALLMRWGDFASFAVPSGSWVRVAIANTSGAALDFRQISVGERLQFPIGQWQDVSPPQLYQGVVVENVIAVNGSFIGRNIRRLEKKGDLSLPYLTQAWVRDEWDAFAIHAGRYAWWHRWNPVGYPDEISFASADSIDAPANSNPPGYMRVSMPFRFLTA